MAEQNATVDLNGEEILQFIEINKAANTVRKTRSDLNVWNKWCATVNEHRKVEDIPAKELNRLLSHFFVSLKTVLHSRPVSCTYNMNIQYHCKVSLKYHLNTFNTTVRISNIE